MSDWKTIETAPKDGRKILLLSIGSNGPRDTYYECASWFELDPEMNPFMSPDNMKFWNGWPYSIKPSHWMSLPPPPSKAKQE